MLALAVIPSAVLFYVIWRCDKNGKEPPGLLFRLFIFGALSLVPILIAEVVLEDFTEEFFAAESGMFLVVDNFIGTALIEEGGKYCILKRTTWKHPAFNYSFDAVVYAVVVSLGYATVENILFIMGDSLSTAIARAVFSIPGHVIFAVFMGCYYGKAKLAAEKTKDRKRNLRLALWVPVLLHGFYDFCLSAENDSLIFIFLAFAIVITVLAIRRVRKLSKEDQEIEAPGAV